VVSVDDVDDAADVVLTHAEERAALAVQVDQR
jgi:hypothetical protein